jgi:hypothetical protein
MTGQEVFRAQDGLFVEVWHQEDLPSVLTQLGLQPPPALMMRLAARHSAWRFKRAQRSHSPAPPARQDVRRRTEPCQADGGQSLL